MNANDPNLVALEKVAMAWAICEKSLSSSEGARSGS
jgi:hypothetical protein